MPLTEYYHYLINRVSDSTSLAYINVLEPYFLWLKYKSLYVGNRVSWDCEPIAIQTVIRQYLQKEMGCKVRDQNKFEKVILTNKSIKTVNLFLASIKGFYKFAVKSKIYMHQNPLINLDWEDSMPQVKGERENRPRMPKLAGTEEPLQTVHRRITDSYFKVINDEWVPEIIGDQDLPYQIYIAGERIKWSCRDEVIIRFMFETGARISEILGLTFGDYRKRTDKHELSAFNKGSHKRRIKFLKISPETLKLLIRYINTERIKYSKEPQKFDNASDEQCIFISQRGTDYTYNAFMRVWTRIISAANIKLNPHKARHWFVTSMLRGIYETSTTVAEIEEKKKQLIDYMKWRDSETINVYEHYFDEEKFRDIHSNLIENYTKRETVYLNNKKVQSNKKEISSKNSIIETDKDNQWLLNLFDGMDD
ncbi:tyrosine-type recombinase/integrase [Paenibacillus sp. FJAT-27812]|uniref:tyrosine-type recombinase/integrase n=1 Tax=Paenibacillus sp. FJAT-27812 TaxID=1684143 RepID=UPI0009E665D4|nr:site-specific integrase [Paenibacillus sp. FJAT-27812]